MVSVLSLAVSNFKWLFILLYMMTFIVMLHIHNTKPKSFPHPNHVSPNKKEEMQTQLPRNRKFAEEVSSNTEPDCCCWSFTRSFLSHRFTYSDNDNYGPYLESVNGVAGNNEARTYWQLLANVTNSEFKPTEVGKLTVKCSITFLVVFNLSYFIDTSIEYF